MNTLFNVVALARQDLKTLVPYEAPFFPDVIKLDANENPYGFPPEIMVKVFRDVSPLDFTRYPDAGATALRESLAGYTGVNLENIMVGNGSDEVILNLMLAFGSGAKFAVATPTFSMYKVHGRIASCEMVEVPRLKDFSLDVKAVKKAASSPGVKLVLICSPNNPTGNAIPRKNIEEIADCAKSLVVVDEAYVEFGGESCIPLLSRYPNLVVLRTFSKAFGMAGLRVGYLLASRPVMDELLKVKQPYNLNVFSQIAAKAVMENLPIFLKRVERILLERNRLFKELSLLPGVEVFPSQSNFIMFRTLLPAGTLFGRMLEKGVLIRNVEGPALPRCLRVSVGAPEENMVFIKMLGEILKGIQV